MIISLGNPTIENGRAHQVNPEPPSGDRDRTIVGRAVDPAQCRAELRLKMR